jgi:hypothetical protein
VSGREPAWRVLAAELLASTQEERGEGDRAASFVLSPLGARMNRVLLVGTLGSAEAIGHDETAPFLRSRLTDPTGTVPVTAGSFQPRAMEQLRLFPAPATALVVGKAHLFRGRDDVAYPSVRAEALRPLADDAYRMLLVEAADQTLRRAAIVRRLGQAIPDDANLSGPGVPARWVAGARAARTRYPDADPDALLAAVREVLRELRAAPSAPAAPSPPAPAPSAEARPMRAAAAAPAPVGPASVFLEILDEMTERSGDGFANLDELIQAAARRGIRDEEAEELLGRLEESGAVEEPVVGKLRRA